MNNTHKENNMSQVKTVDFLEAEPVRGTSLALIESGSVDVVKLFSGEGLEPLIEKIAEQVRSEIFDVTTEKGRKRIGSVARQIGSAKERLKEAADKLTEEAKRQVNGVAAEKSKMIAAFDSLRDEIKEPLNAYNKREEDRASAHEAALRDMSSFLAWDSIDHPAEAIQEALNKSDALYNSREWEEFQGRAKYQYDANVTTLAIAVERRRKHDTDQAELTRLKAEENERVRKAEEKRIADESAAKATKDAEEKAEIARKVEADRVQKEKDVADAALNQMQKEKDDIEEAANKAEGARVDSLVAAMSRMNFIEDGKTSGAVMAKLTTLSDLYKFTDWQEYTKAATTAYEANVSNLQSQYETLDAQEKLAAAEAEIEREKTTKLREEAAAQRERDRQKEESKERAAVARRAVTPERQKEVNSAIISAIKDVMENEKMPDAQARAILVSIAKGLIPNVTISY